jgi:hypothetical protein
MRSGADPNFFNRLGERPTFLMSWAHEKYCKHDLLGANFWKNLRYMKNYFEFKIKRESTVISIIHLWLMYTTGINQLNNLINGLHDQWRANTTGHVANNKKIFPFSWWKVHMKPEMTSIGTKQYESMTSLTSCWTDLIWTNCSCIVVRNWNEKAFLYQKTQPASESTGGKLQREITAVIRNGYVQVEIQE